MVAEKALNLIFFRNDVEAQQTPEKKDSKKTTILGKIFVSTPERRRSTEENSSEALIQAVLRWVSGAESVKRPFLLLMTNYIGKRIFTTLRHW